MKKKYTAITKEQQHEIEAEAKYSRLVAIATKSVRKECKIIKSFECQKIVRKIKTIRADDIASNSTITAGCSTTLGATERKPSSNEDNVVAIKSIPNENNDVASSKLIDNVDNNKTLSKITKLEEKLRFTKEFDLDEVVCVCLIRLGLRQKPKSEVFNRDTNEEQLVAKASATSHDSTRGVENRNGNVNDENRVNFPSHGLPEKDEGKSGSSADVVTNRKLDCHVENDSKASLIESMLRHKRIGSITKSINEKISEHSAWLSQREKWISSSSVDKGGRGDNRKKKRGLDSCIDKNNKSDFSRASKSKKTKLNNEERGRMRRGDKMDILGHDGNSDLFIDSLAGNNNSNGNEFELNSDSWQERGNYDYGYEDNYPPQKKEKKKNRQGQRARKAKAMAIEARKAGLVWDSSVNWREAKTKANTTKQKKGEQIKIEKNGKKSRNHSSGYNSLTKKTLSASGLDTSKNVKVSDVAMMDGKNWKEDGNAHPSWAAREAQKSKSSGVGVMQFTGKKITFN